MAKYTRSGVFEASLAIVAEYLAAEFENFGDSKLATQYLRNAADLRSFGRVYKQKPQSSDEAPVYGKDNEKLKYPFMGLVLGQLGLDPHRAGYKKNHFTNGRMIGKDTDKNTAYFESHRPVKVTVGATLETDDIQEIIQYATMLFEIGPRIALSVQSEETGHVTEFGLQFDMDLTIPPADSSTTGDPYRFEHTLTLDTYTGIASTLPLIRNVKVSAKIGTRVEDTVFNIDDMQPIILKQLRYYELFDKASDSFKYDWQKEHDR